VFAAEGLEGVDCQGSDGRGGYCYEDEAGGRRV
jgi:hypothetical protein